MDKLKFRSAMIRQGYTQEALSNDLGMSVASLSYKINGHREFTLSEIQRIQQLLHLDFNETQQIFFSDSVKEKQQNA